MQKVFIDTNILVYSIDENSAEKYGKSIALLNKLEESNIVTISTQSLKEFINVSIKKLKISKESTLYSEDLSNGQIVDGVKS